MSDTNHEIRQRNGVNARTALSALDAALGDATTAGPIKAKMNPAKHDESYMACSIAVNRARAALNQCFNADGSWIDTDEDNDTSPVHSRGSDDAPQNFQASGVPLVGGGVASFEELQARRTPANGLHLSGVASKWVDSEATKKMMEDMQAQAARGK